MQVIASSKSARVAPRKVRLVADAIRKLSIEDALKALSILKNRGGQPLEAVLKSAIANALNNNNLKQDALKIKTIDVLEAPAYKRFHPSTRGRVHPYKRKGSHIKIILETKVVQKTIDAEVTQEKQKEEK
jgi:large subunit ribosomal protein L22